MDIGIKHFHVLLVVLFVLSTLIKTILLFTNSKKFDNYRAKTKVPEIIVTVLFLITGISLIVIKGGGFHTLFWVKLGLMIVGIPLTIVGFKKNLKIPALLGTFLFILTYGMAEMASNKATEKKVETSDEEKGSLSHGAKLYTLNCVPCHGETGTKKYIGAADLSASSYSEQQIIKMVSKGNSKMPPFKTLNEAELKALALYVKGIQQ